ncbi:hypothetical protein [Klebsiella pneumoniae]|uniref:hypothetical protein n=1 Tax=Klebsiella pneumoniae TaxID=573 RepID=UPI00211AD40D|nr:hypothetical protein [Klebsiella pneumoniae]MCJ3719059.1 hypothetical protein [Klebsiella pneumoniae]
MNISTVNELIASLGSAGELSIREQKFLKLAKAFKQVAGENVALKTFCKNAAFDADYESELGMERGGFTDALNNIETPATDRIVAGIKADGIDEAAVELDRVDTVASTRVIEFKLREFSQQLREGAK